MFFLFVFLILYGDSGVNGVLVEVRWKLISGLVGYFSICFWFLLLVVKVVVNIGFGFFLFCFLMVVC